MNDKEAKENPEEEQESYAKPKLHTHEPLRNVTGSGPYAQPTFFPPP